MKTLIIGLFAALLFASACYAATQYNAIGNVQLSTSTMKGGLILHGRTRAQLTALTPDATGQILYCTNCTDTPVCISSGTLPGAWVAVSVSTMVTNGFGGCL